jgi:hypothetical protein
MYIINAFFSIVPGNEPKAYAALGALAAQIERTEPDTWFYLIHTPDFDPGINIYPPPALYRWRSWKATRTAMHSSPITTARTWGSSSPRTAGSFSTCTGQSRRS